MYAKKNIMISINMQTMCTDMQNRICTTMCFQNMDKYPFCAYAFCAYI